MNSTVDGTILIMIHIHLQRRDNSGYNEENKRHNDTFLGGVSGSLHVELSMSQHSK